MLAGAHLLALLQRIDIHSFGILGLGRNIVRINFLVDARTSPSILASQRRGQSFVHRTDENPRGAIRNDRLPLLAVDERDETG
jgi:hypothetical protein